MMAPMWRHELLMGVLTLGVLALGLLGCNKIGPGESGIRGHVPVGEDSWVPAPGEQICASKHELSDDPICSKVGRDGSFELPLSPGTYWLCERGRGKHLSCPSMCPYQVSTGEVTEVDAADLLTPMPDGQGFYGTSTGSFGEMGYLNVPHPVRVCVGPPDTPTGTAISTLTCAETDRCGRYVLSVPEGSYRVLFAEIGEDTTSDRQYCLYPISAGQTIRIDRVTGRGGSRTPCAEGSTPDPRTQTELVAELRELARLNISHHRVPRDISEELVSHARARMSTGASMETIAAELQVGIEWLRPILDDKLSSDPR
jgi:hypothetical protein